MVEGVRAGVGDGGVLALPGEACLEVGEGGVLVLPGKASLEGEFGEGGVLVLPGEARFEVGEDGAGEACLRGEVGVVGEDGALAFRGETGIGGGGANLFALCASACAAVLTARVRKKKKNSYPCSYQESGQIDLWRHRNLSNPPSESLVRSWKDKIKET